MRPSQWLLPMCGGAFIAMGYIMAWWGGFLMAAGMYFSWRLLTYGLGQMFAVIGYAHTKHGRRHTTV